MPRVMTEEHKQKMREGREARRKALAESRSVSDTAVDVHPHKNPEDEAIPAVMSHYSDVRIIFDWRRAPMEEAQKAYSILRAEFENAGRILNERSMPTPGSYKCFMCRIVHPGDARGKDDSYEDPGTKLRVPVRVCGENCWISYTDYRIRERSLRNDMNAGLISAEDYVRKARETLEAMRTLQNQKVLKTA